MSTKQFCQIAKVMGGPDAAVKVINPKHWPDFNPDNFAELAFELDPDGSERVMAEHFRILEIAKWAEARIA